MSTTWPECSLRGHSQVRQQSPFYGWCDADAEAIALALPKLPCKGIQESHFRCPTSKWSGVSLASTVIYWGKAPAPVSPECSQGRFWSFWSMKFSTALEVQGMAGAYQLTYFLLGNWVGLWLQ